jgi:hypothetical protein
MPLCRPWLNAKLVRFSSRVIRRYPLCPFQREKPNFIMRSPFPASGLRDQSAPAISNPADVSQKGQPLDLEPTALPVGHRADWRVDAVSPHALLDYGTSLTCRKARTKNSAPAATRRLPASAFHTRHDCRAIHRHPALAPIAACRNARANNLGWRPPENRSGNICHLH